jgi:hypothetical protein
MMFGSPARTKTHFSDGGNLVQTLGIKLFETLATLNRIAKVIPQAVINITRKATP